MKSRTKSAQLETQEPNTQSNAFLQDLHPFNIANFGTNDAPTTAANLVPNAVSDSAASEIPHVVLQYYRYLGTTAIVPGHKKVSLKVVKDSQTLNTPAEGVVDSLIDHQTGLPQSELLPALLDAFFEYYGSIFCFLNRTQLDSLIARNEISSFLLCSIAALSSRFCSAEIFTPYFSPLIDGRDRKPWEFCLPFLRQAKRLLLPLISIPSCDLVAGLLFLALAEFGNNDEAGIWICVNAISETLTNSQVCGCSLV